MYESRLLSFGTAGSKDRLSFLHNERIRGKIILINMILEDDEMKIIDKIIEEPIEIDEENFIKISENIKKEIDKETNKMIKYSKTIGDTRYGPLKILILCTIR